MAKNKSQPFNNPFGNLKLTDEPKKAAPGAPKVAAKPVPKKVVDEEAAMFLEAVGEVERVSKGPKLAPPKAPPDVKSLNIPNEEAESLARLAELVSGEGEFDLADSDEFIEGAVQGLDRGVLRKLKAGDFAVRAHLDLHGLVKAEAKEALVQFITKARLDGHRCVLVVTGRGLHSKDQIPVLKESAQEWLSRGRLQKQVLAFCTARPLDGGAVALYVLLRR